MRILCFFCLQDLSPSLLQIINLFKTRITETDFDIYNKTEINITFLVFQSYVSNEVFFYDCTRNRKIVNIISKWQPKTTYEFYVIRSADWLIRRDWAGEAGIVVVHWHRKKTPVLLGTTATDDFLIEVL